MENQGQTQVTQQQSQNNQMQSQNNLSSQIQDNNQAQTSSQQLSQDQVLNKDVNNPNLDQQNQQILQNNNNINVQVIEPIKIIKPPTPDEIQLKPDTQTLQMLSLIINRLRILEKNIAVYDDELREEHMQRELKLNQINNDINEMYEEYNQYMQSQQDDLKQLEQKIKVEIDYNLIRIMENKLKMDREVYIMRKKLYERTVRMRELQVKVYGYKQEKKDYIQKVKELEQKVEEREKEIRRLQDIVYDVTTLNIKPNFAMGSNQLSVPKFKNYDQYMITQQKEAQQQKYFMDNQTLKFGRKQGEVLTKDGIWQTQLLGNSISNKNLLANTGKMLLQNDMNNMGSGLRDSYNQRGGVMQTLSLNDLLPDSWINNKYINSIEKPKFEETINERESYIGQSSNKSQSINGGNHNKYSPTNSDMMYGQRQYY